MFDLGLKECFFMLKMKKGDEKFLLKHVFRLPSFDDWFRYQKKRKFMGLSKGKDTFEFANVMQEEDLSFWESLIIKVEGYTSAGQDLMEAYPEGWQEKIPIRHKLEAIAGFLIFNREEEPDSSLTEGSGFDVDAEASTEMKFVASQNGTDRYVVFKFRQPESSDFVRFSRLTSKLQLVRTKQRGVQEMRMPADIRPFIEMFDKLIVAVEGYAFDGKPLMEVEGWIQKIDAFHKREAVRELFTSPLLEDEVEEGN